MATYNRSAYLNRSITSFISQTYKNAELIVVDDGSSDDTFRLVNKFITNYPNIRYLKHSNRNVSLTKNAGIQAAIGRYTGFLDSDDEFRPDYLEKRVKFLEAHPEIDMIESEAIIIGDPFVKDKNDLSKKIHLSKCHIGATFFGKTEVFLALNGFDKNLIYGADSDLWEKAAKKYVTKKFDHPGYIYYRDIPDSICNSI